MGIIGNNFFALKADDKNTTVLTFDSQTLKLEREVELTMKFEKKKLTQVDGFVFNKKLHLITKYENRLEGEEVYQLHELNDNFEFSKSIVIGRTGWIPLGNSVNSAEKERAKKVGMFTFEYHISEDKKTLMTSYSLDGASTTTELFDKDLNRIGKNIMSLQYEKFFPVSTCLSNSGRFYMTGFDAETVKAKGVFKKDKLVSNDFHILVFDAVNGEVQDVELALEKDVTNVRLKILDDESFIAFGMYADEIEKGVSGAFFQKISKEGTVIFTTFEPIESNDIKSLAAENGLDDTEQYNFKLHDLVIKESGEYLMLAEQYYVVLTIINNGTSTFTTREYYHDDVIALNFDTNGKVLWNKKIEKRQYSKHYYIYSSFLSFEKANNVYLIYNDKESDAPGANKDAMKKSKNTVAILVSIDENGEYSEKTLYNYDGDKSRTILPSKCEKIGDSSMLLITLGSKKEEMLGIISP